MKIYLAGPWARREDVRDARNYIHRLAGNEVEVISHWIDHEVTNAVDEQTVEAHNDIDDLEQAEALVVLNLEKSEGKAFEQGYAYGRHIPVIVVGDQTNVFHHLRDVTVVATVAEAVVKLVRWHHKPFGGVVDHSPAHI